MSRHVNHAFVQSARQHKGIDTHGRPAWIWVDTGIRRACRLVSARGRRASVWVKAPLEMKWNTKGLARCDRCEVALDIIHVEVEAIETLGTLQSWDAD